MKKLAVLLFACLTILLAYSGAAAQQPTPSDDEVNRIAHQLYCPVCENIPLDTCPTEACARWRDQIRQQLSDGWTEQQIKDYFVEQYGDRVLASPPVQGKGRALNYLIYILPFAILIVGGYMVVRAFMAWYKPNNKGKPAAQPPAESDEYISRIEEELKKR